MATRNDITGDKIQSRVSNKNFNDNFDAIFRKNPTQDKNTMGYPPLATDKPVDSSEDWDEKRMDIIGSNGPTGEHYKGK